MTARLVRSEAEAVERIAGFGPYLSCLGIAGGEGEERLAQKLAWAGLNRVCEIGQMQRPPWAGDMMVTGFCCR